MQEELNQPMKKILIRTNHPWLKSRQNTDAKEKK
jgi:hypothetical protein